MAKSTKKNGGRRRRVNRGTRKSKRGGGLFGSSLTCFNANSKVGSIPAKQTPISPQQYQVAARTTPTQAYTCKFPGGQTLYYLKKKSFFGLF
jgi:hypothetical protein